MSLATVDEALGEIKAGQFVIVVDDEDRENEGDLIIAAEKVTPEAINFMATHGRGLICMPVTGKRLDELQIPLMVQHNTAAQGTAFTISVEAKHATTTGISVYDRAATVKTIIDPATGPDDIAMPGHMFPLRAKDGGVLERSGHTEATIDLARLAGLYPAGVLCEIMNEDGTMARLAQLEEFGKKHQIKIISIAQLIAYRHQREQLVHRVTEAQLPTRWGDFTAIAYKSDVDSDEHVALTLGDLSGSDPVLVRVHSQCLTGDVFGSLRCDCGEQMALALQRIAVDGRGVFLYMRQEGRGIGLHNKLKAYALQDLGMDTVEANVALGFPPDPRQYGIGAQILVDLGLSKIKLLTNNPKKRVGLESYGLQVVDQVPIIAPMTPQNRRYMETKRDKLGHIFDAPDIKTG